LLQQIAGDKKRIAPIERIGTIACGETRTITLGIDFNDTTQGVKLNLLWSIEESDGKKVLLTIKAPVGELLRAVNMSENTFTSQQGIFLTFSYPSPSHYACLFV